MAIETGLEITVYSDSDYSYVVAEGTVTYKEDRGEGGVLAVEISFGSIDEMEATAKAMLKMVEFQREGL